MASRTSAWLPSGNRTICRAAVGDNRPTRKSSRALDPNRSINARRRHTQALSIAREIGARAEEARALAGIGRSLLPASPAKAAAHLREALVIAQRIGSLEARRIQDTLTEHGL